MFLITSWWIWSEHFGCILHANEKQTDNFDLSITYLRAINATCHKCCISTQMCNKKCHIHSQIHWTMLTIWQNYAVKFSKSVKARNGTFYSFLTLLAGIRKTVWSVKIQAQQILKTWHHRRIHHGKNIPCIYLHLTSLVTRVKLIEMFAEAPISANCPVYRVYTE